MARLTYPVPTAFVAVALAITAPVAAQLCAGATLDCYQPPISSGSNAVDSDTLFVVSRPLSGPWTARWLRYDPTREHVREELSFQFPGFPGSIGFHGLAVHGETAACIVVTSFAPVPVLKLVTMERLAAGARWNAVDIPGIDRFLWSDVVGVTSEAVLALVDTSWSQQPQTIVVFERNAIGELERRNDAVGTTLRTIPHMDGQAMSVDGRRLAYTGLDAAGQRAIGIVERDPLGTWGEVAVSTIPVGGAILGTRSIALHGDRCATVEPLHPSSDAGLLVRIFTRQSATSWVETQALQAPIPPGMHGVALHEDRLLVGSFERALLYTADATGSFGSPLPLESFGTPLTLDDTVAIGRQGQRFLRCVRTQAASAGPMQVCELVGNEYCGDPGAPRLRVHARFGHWMSSGAAEVMGLPPGGWAALYLSSHPASLPSPGGTVCIEPLVQHTILGPVRADVLGHASLHLPSQVGYFHEPGGRHYGQALTSSGSHRRWSTAVVF